MSYMTDERRMIQQTARDFAMNEVLPVANKLDPEQGDIPMALRDKLAEMGYFGIVIREEYGGLGLGAFEYVLITEELARAWMSVASIIARGNGLGGGFSAEQGANICRGWRAENSSARLRCRRRTRAPISPTSRAKRPATATAGYSTAVRCGARSLTVRTSSRCWRAPGSRPIHVAGTRGSVNSWCSRSAASFHRG